MSDASEIEMLRELIERHAQLTESTRATEILADWPNQVTRFWKVVPKLAPTESDAPASEPAVRGDAESRPVPQGMHAQSRALASSDAAQDGQYEAPPSPL
jgi:glutamate synthase domain-containing protein 3